MKDIQNWTVLVVDDEPDNRGVIEKVLTFHGAIVYTATNGLEGLAALDDIIPTFILLDLSMPHMDGWEMFKKVRAHPKTAHIPIIALTAHAMDGDEVRVLEFGFNGYIAKPFHINTLLPKIQQCLYRSTPTG